MFEDFSTAYYRASMEVVEYDDGPVIEQSVYDFIDSELLGEIDSPVFMRVGMNVGDRFAVGAESAIPRDVLAVPDGSFERGQQNVYVVKPNYINTVGKFYG